MEEILASIRRIIADDDAKPAAAADKPGAQAAAKPAAPAAAPAKAATKMTGIPPSAIAPKPAASPPPPMPAPAETNSQDDIDAMLASLDAATTEDEVRAAPEAEEVFELTDEMALPDSAPASFQKVDPQDDLEFAEPPSPLSRPVPPAPQPSVSSAGFSNPAPTPQLQAAQILSHSTVSAVESAFNTLANTVLSNNARTLEDLVKEMLRPMLKSWLDDNLPGLVERIVKAEIERVSRGRS
jgi:cell pole-organizing protein PopZ